MAPYNKFDKFVEDLLLGVHANLNAAGTTVKVYLSNALPSPSADAIKADLAEIAAGNGYTAGGPDIEQTITRAGTAGASTASMNAVDKTITASGGSIPPFQYVVCYNDTPTSPVDPLISWWDYGSALPGLATGETFTIDFGSNKVFDLV